MAPVHGSRLESEDEDDIQKFGPGSDSESLDDGSRGDDSPGIEDGENLDLDDDEASEDEEAVERKIQNVSFGALKQAQDSLARKRKRGSDNTADQEEKLHALRTRLNEIRSKSKGSASDQKLQHVDRETRSTQPGSGTRSAGVKRGHEDSDSDSDSAPSEVENVKSRTSKHAPASQSSKRQVSRKRDVIDVPKRKTRDPRFDALQQRSGDTENNAKAYSFLRDYQKDEIAELKSAIKQARNDDDKETLKRKMNSMQNRIKSQEAKEREQDVLRQHRREEKEKVQQGKTPYYLKTKDVKERAMVEKFKGMKSKDRERLMQKRRQKEDQKEKRRMPDARRSNG